MYRKIKLMMRNSMAVFPAAVAAGTLVLFFMLVQFEAIDSRIMDSKPVTYTVGDEEGWDLSIDMQSWAKGKAFHAGDFLVFKYDDQRFDVAVVNEEGYNTCTVNDGAKVFDSGEDTIQLVFGPTYFIDSVAEVCAAGLKMFINATAPPPSF